MHSCDNPPCCNPAHLSIGTHFDNMSDMTAKLRYVLPKSRIGEDHHKARLTTNDILVIHRMVKNGHSQRFVARKYGVTHNAIGKIIRGETWRHVEK